VSDQPAPRRGRKLLVASLVVTALSVAVAVIFALALGNEIQRTKDIRLTPSVQVGQVKVTYDPEIKQLAGVLAAEGARAIPVIAGVLGKPAPRDHLFTVNAYADPAEFQRRMGREEDSDEVGGRSSPLGQAYVHWYLSRDRLDSGEVRRGSTFPPPLLQHSDFLHELTHLVAFETYPQARARTWPLWLTEGLPELATWKSLEQASADAARSYEDHQRARWYLAAARKTLPTTSHELLAADVGPDLSARYVTSYRLFRHLDQAGELPRFMSLISDGAEPEAALRKVVDVDRLWPQLFARASAESRVTYFALGGTVDRIGDAYRLVSHAKRDARLVIIGNHESVPTISVEFALRPVGSRRVDIYPRFNPDGSDHLKVAIVPGWIQVFKASAEEGERLLAEASGPRLAVGEEETLVWHRMDVRWRDKLVVELDGQRTTIAVPAPPARDPQPVALGSSAGVTYFKNWRIATGP
jgi:hypothetical protein